VQAASCATRSLAGQVDVVGVPGQASAASAATEPASTGFPWPSVHWNFPLVQTQKSVTVATPHVYSGPQVNPGTAHATPMVSSGVVGQMPCTAWCVVGGLELDEQATTTADAAPAAAAAQEPHPTLRPEPLTMRGSAGCAA
jgi:hypothetical protein